LEVPKRAYAVWWTADLVIEYLEKQEGAWPRSWDDLRTLDGPASRITETQEPDGSKAVEFRPTPKVDELRQLVEIDWNADPQKLLEEGRKGWEPPFRVIYLRDGRKTHYEGKEPNRMVFEYLVARERAKAEPTSK
jgi:hypothetical protein